MNNHAAQYEIVSIDSVKVKVNYKLEKQKCPTPRNGTLLSFILARINKLCRRNTIFIRKFFDKSRYFCLSILGINHSTLVPVNVYPSSGSCNVSLEEVRETTFTIS